MPLLQSPEQEESWHSGQLKNEELARKALINLIEVKSEPGITGLGTNTKVPPLPPQVQSFLSQRCLLGHWTASKAKAAATQETKEKQRKYIFYPVLSLQPYLLSAWGKRDVTWLALQKGKKKQTF